ncbi:MAG: type II toxin-antitoxin system RelE/ParE family toxin [Alphaproteobacteria bacterium]|nr:type II toxin-antitoxin system RelE/ParE family toxin [Alphaproteobacteria bacterium]
MRRRRNSITFFDWIAKDDPRAALEVVARIAERINMLELDAVAHMGRRGHVAGTRELIESPYIIVYQVIEARGEIVVLSVVHGAQDRGGN